MAGKRRHRERGQQFNKHLGVAEGQGTLPRGPGGCPGQGTRGCWGGGDVKSELPPGGFAPRVFSLSEDPQLRIHPPALIPPLSPCWAQVVTQIVSGMMNQGDGSAETHSGGCLSGNVVKSEQDRPADLHHPESSMNSIPSLGFTHQP